MNRFGQNSDDVNKDGFFDDSQSEKSSNELSSDDDSILVNEHKTTKSTTALRTQVARIEAKLEDVSSMVQKIVRMVISLTTNRTSVCDDTIAPNFLSIFPLKTEESLAKFEQDLSDGTFRNAVVILYVILLVILIYLSLCKFYVNFMVLGV